MPQKQQWTSNSVDGALLYILFQDKYEHPDNFSAAGIFQNPLFPFKDKYDSRKFNNYCHTAANRAKKFVEFGTGLSDTFKEFVAEARVKYADILEELSEEKDDDSFAPGEGGEEDIPFNLEEYDDELSLNGQIQNSRLDSRHSRMPSTAAAPSTKTKKTNGSKTTRASSANPSPVAKLLTEPYIIEYPSKDKLFVQIPMSGNVEEDDDFKVEVLTRKVLSWMRIPPELESAYELLGEEGRLADDEEECLHCSGDQ
ncbi:MAG: hypothetical protein SGARI_001982 [Bacillariaceae sp.]